MEDSAIIDLYWAREERALSETDTKYGGYCRSIAHNILKNREYSEEWVCDTWLHAWNAMPPQRPSILSSFLGRITRNLSFDRCRRQNAEKRGGGSLPLALDELSECVPAPGCPLFGIVQPPVDLGRQIGGGVKVEFASVRQGVGLGGAPGRVGDNGHQAAGDGLQAGDALGLHGGAVDIEVRIV